MKSSSILAFVVSTLVLIVGLWFVMPAEGLAIGPATIRFASLEQDLAEAGETKVDVDAVLAEAQQRLEIISSSRRDSVKYFKSFINESPERFYFPGDDYHFFDDIFRSFESARRIGKTYRIMHYGDSQIEMDRISLVLRDSLQAHFGGTGVGLIPAVQRVPTYSTNQSWSGSMTRYIVFGDSTTVRAPHKGYGLMAQFSRVTGSATVSVRPTRNKSASERVKTFSRISVLVGNSSGDFKVSIKCDTLKPIVRNTEVAAGSVDFLTWDLPHNVSNATITMTGSADVYGIMLDGKGGVAVDNDALRGCSGTIFTRVSKESMAGAYAKNDTKLIIMQFGGNMVPSISSAKNISSYLENLNKQFAYFREVAPKAKILFIGPSDMSSMQGGRMKTRPHLVALNDSLKVNAVRNGVAYWDMFAAMGGENSMAQWVSHKPAYAGPDYIHFTPLGAEYMGGILSKAFLNCYDFYRLRKKVGDDQVKKIWRESN